MLNPPESAYFYALITASAEDYQWYKIPPIWQGTGGAMARTSLMAGKFGLSSLQLVVIDICFLENSQVLLLACLSNWGHWDFLTFHIKGILMDWIVSPPNSYVEAKTPSISECDLFKK